MSSVRLTPRQIMEAAERWHRLRPRYNTHLTPEEIAARRSR